MTLWSKAKCTDPWILERCFWVWHFDPRQSVQILGSLGDVSGYDSLIQGKVYRPLDPWEMFLGMTLWSKAKCTDTWILGRCFWVWLFDPRQSVQTLGSQRDVSGYDTLIQGKVYRPLDPWEMFLGMTLWSKAKCTDPWILFLHMTLWSKAKCTDTWILARSYRECKTVPYTNRFWCVFFFILLFF